MRATPKREKNSSNDRVLTPLVLGSFFAGVLITGVLAWILYIRLPASKTSGLRESDFATSRSDYKFVDPLIGIKGVDNAAKYNDLQAQVAAYIEGEKRNGLISAAVDFRDINEPGGFTLNPTELYTPASLIKVPVMMAYYKLAETDSAILSQKITYTGAQDSNAVQDIKSGVQLSPGTKYTIEQLIRHMIRYSDNNAADLLTGYLRDTDNLRTYIAVFSDLGVDPKVLSTYTDNTTVKEYSMFLRALYNATYLTREASEHALQLLSQTDFAAGIESGVPNYVSVAQKFGEVRMVNTSGTFIGKEINDCGIIYYPRHPYLLCIMTKKMGNDVSGLEHQIATISRIVYQKMQSYYP